MGSARELADKSKKNRFQRATDNNESDDEDGSETDEMIGDDSQQTDRRSEETKKGHALRPMSKNDRQKSLQQNRQGSQDAQSKKSNSRTQQAQQMAMQRMSFKLARPDNSVSSKFYEDILFGSNRRNAITQPIPFGAG